jgi:tRNA (guanine37-N1)-methyltransferase
MHFHIITLFPEAMKGYFATSILGRAQKEKRIRISYYNPRDYTKDKWRRIDRRPYGGGPGMVIEPLSVLKAVEAARKRAKRGKIKIIFLSAGGKQFTNTLARSYAVSFKHLVLIAGHYEGIDARVRTILKAEEVSVGPYILTGGEAPALLIADATSRQIKGVLGNFDSR